MKKVGMYGTRLMVLDESAMTLSLHSVADVKKQFKDWVSTGVVETKKIDAAWLEKFEKLWESTGKHLMDL